MSQLRGALDRLWYVQPAVELTARGTPHECLRALAEAARPSLNRLHLRNLFTDGRRYFLMSTDAGFRLTSNSSIPWRYRARTSVAAVLDGQFETISEGTTRIHLRSRMRLLFLLDIFLLPAFLTSLMIFAPWPPAIITFLAGLLFILSYIWHRLTATLQVADMVYFVQKALEDLTPAAPAGLVAGSGDVISGEFRRQWEKFYRQHRDDLPREPVDGEEPA